VRRCVFEYCREEFDRTRRKRVLGSDISGVVDYFRDVRYDRALRVPLGTESHGWAIREARKGWKSVYRGTVRGPAIDMCI